MSRGFFSDLQIVLTLDVYGVKSTLGITYGYRGFFEEALEPIVVSPLALTSCRSSRAIHVRVWSCICS